LRDRPRRYLLVSVGTIFRTDNGLLALLSGLWIRSRSTCDVAFGAPRIQFCEEGEAEQTRPIDLDNLEEQRLATVMRQAHHDQQLRRYHDCNIKETFFNVGDLVLRSIQKTDGMHKLSAPWEGPFIITKVISPSTYRL
jgi:hypothetical protein